MTGAKNNRWKGRESGRMGPEARRRGQREETYDREVGGSKPMRRPRWRHSRGARKRGEQPSDSEWEQLQLQLQSKKRRLMRSSFRSSPREGRPRGLSWGLGIRARVG